MEILIRIAKGKYIEFGTMTSLTEAYEKLLIEHILPMTDKLVPWDMFRTMHMWNLPVNDMMMVNMKLLGKLYNEIVELKEFRTRHNKCITTFKVATIDQIIAFFGNSLPNINDVTILKAFHMSKMSRIEPMLESDTSFTFLKWVEFLEFLPRLAFYMFRNTP